MLGAAELDLLSVREAVGLGYVLDIYIVKLALVLFFAAQRENATEKQKSKKSKKANKSNKLKWQKETPKI